MGSYGLVWFTVFARLWEQLYLSCSFVCQALIEEPLPDLRRVMKISLYKRLTDKHFNWNGLSILFLRRRKAARSEAIERWLAIREIGRHKVDGEDVVLGGDSVELGNRSHISNWAGEKVDL